MCHPVEEMNKELTRMAAKCDATRKHPSLSQFVLCSPVIFELHLKKELGIYEEVSPQLAVSGPLLKKMGHCLLSPQWLL